MDPLRRVNKSSKLEKIRKETIKEKMDILKTIIDYIGQNNLFGMVPRIIVKECQQK